MSQPTHGNACEKSMNDGDVDISSELKRRIAPIRLKLPFATKIYQWQYSYRLPHLLPMLFFVGLLQGVITVSIYNGGAPLLWFCDDPIAHRNVTPCVIAFNSLQLAFAAFLIFAGFFWRKEALLALRGWGTIGCGSCGRPYDIERMPVHCPECGADLEAENSLKDYREWQNKTFARFMASPLRPVLMIMFVMYISIAGWINFINKLF